MAFEAYAIAVKLSLVSNVAAGLASLSGQFRQLNQHVGTTQNSLNGLERKLLDIKRLGLVGGAMAGAGFLGFSMLKAPLEAAKEYELAATRFKTLNLGETINKQADQFARGTQVFGASSKDLMETLRLSVGIFGKDEFNIALAVAPKIAALNAANANLFGGKVGHVDEGAMRSINRFIDMKGLGGNEKDYMHGLDLAQRLVTGSGGNLKFGDLETFAKRGGTAFKSLSDTGLFNMMLAMQEMGGSTAGQSMMSLYQNLVAGRASKKSLNALASLGLVNVGMMRAGQLGGDQFSTLETTSVTGADMARTDPMGWLRQYVLPKLNGMSQDQQFQIVNSLFSNRNASNLGALGIGQVMQVLRDANLGKGAMGADETIAASKGTTAGSLLELQAKWNKLLTELGITILPVAIKAVSGLTDVIKSAINFAKEFPILTKGLMTAFGVLSGLVAAGGVVMLATAAFKALGLALAFGGVGVGVGAAGGAGGILAIAAAFMGPAGLIAALAALGVVAYNVLKTDPNQDHTNEHFDRGNGKGGKWVSNLRNIGSNRFPIMESWVADNTATGSGHWQTVKPAQNQGGGKQGDVYLSGQKVGVIVAPHVTGVMAKEANRPQSGITRFDGSMAPRPPMAAH